MKEAKLTLFSSAASPLSILFRIEMFLIASLKFRLDWKLRKVRQSGLFTPSPWNSTMSAPCVSTAWRTGISTACVEPRLAFVNWQGNSFPFGKPQDKVDRGPSWTWIPSRFSVLKIASTIVFWVVPATPRSFSSLTRTSTLPDDFSRPELFAELRHAAYWYQPMGSTLPLIEKT